MTDVTEKIVELLPGVYVIPGATNVGVITEKINDITNVYLIDSGCTELDSDNILEVLSSFFAKSNSQYKIKAIINTHGHADHIGGNTGLKNQTDCEIWLPDMETACAINPLFQTAMMWGAHPPHELRTVFFNAGRMDWNRKIFDGESVSLEGGTLSFIDLPGHSFQTIAILYQSSTNRCVLFTGDTLFTLDQLAKSPIPFLTNPKDFLSSLEKLSAIPNIECYIPSHGTFITKDVSKTITANKEAIYSVKNLLLETIGDEKKGTEQIVKEISDKMHLRLTLAQYGLVNCTLKSYLSIMHDEGEIKMKIVDNVLLWFKN